MRDYVINTTWLFTAKALSFLVIIVFQKIIPQDDYTTFMLVYSLIIGIQAFAVSGLMSVFDMINADKGGDISGEFNSLISTSVIYSTIIGFFFVIFSGLNLQNSILSIIVGSFTVYSSINGYGNRILERLRMAYRQSYIIPTLALSVAAINYAFTHNITSFLGCWAMSLALMMYFNKDLVRDRLDFNRTILIIAFPFAVISLINWLTGFGINYFLSFKKSSLDLKYFSLGFSFASIIQLTVNSVRHVWLPRFLSDSIKYSQLVQKKSSYSFHIRQVFLQFFLTILFVYSFKFFNSVFNIYNPDDSESILVYITYLSGAYFFQSVWNYLVANCFNDSNLKLYTRLSILVSLLSFVVFLILYRFGVEIYLIYTVNFAFKSLVFGLIAASNDKYFYFQYILTVFLLVFYLCVI